MPVEGRDVQQIVDARQLGRLLRSARQVAGYDTAAEAAVELSKRGGVKMSERVVQGLERGETQLTFAQMVLWTAVMQPPEGPAFFLRAVDPGIMTSWPWDRRR